MGRRVLADRSKRFKIQFGRAHSQRLDQLESNIFSLRYDRKKQMLRADQFGMILLRKAGGDAHDLLAAGRKSLVVKKRQIR